MARASWWRPATSPTAASVATSLDRSPSSARPPAMRIALANIVEDLDRAHDVRSGRGAVGRRPHHNVLEPEPGPCKLAVIGGRVARRRLVMHTSVVGLAERVRGA